MQVDHEDQLAVIVVMLGMLPVAAMQNAAADNASNLPG